MKTEKKMSEILYNRYEYLASKYARKIYSYEQLSFEYEDLLQEMKLKIFTSIRAYGRRWKKYRVEGYARPVPIRYYLEAALSNKTKDFMKYISWENYKVRMDDINYDYGVEDDCKCEPEENKFVVNGIDLLENLKGADRAAFSLYLRGCSMTLITKVYNTKNKKRNKKLLEIGEQPFQASDIIDLQREFLIKTYGSELLKKRTVYQSYSLED